MQRTWADTATNEPTAPTEPAAGTACGHHGGSAPPPAKRPASKGPIPALTLRGRWLEQIGLGVGTQVCIEAYAGGLTIRPVGPVPALAPNVPTCLQRDVHFGEVEAHTHHPHAPWSEK